MPRRPVTNADLFAMLRAWVAENYPGCEATRFRLDIVSRFTGTQKVCLPVPFTAGRPEPEPRAPAHSTDFRSVTVAGKAYSFTPTQAAALRVLWEAYEDGTPEIGQATILEAAGSETTRLRDLFRSGAGETHEAWGTLIVPGGRGAFRLALE